MKEIIAYEMLYNKAFKYQNDIICVPFQKKYWNEYMSIYNECFYKNNTAEVVFLNGCSIKIEYQSGNP